MENKSSLALELARLLQERLSNKDDELAYVLSLDLVEALEAMQPTGPARSADPSRSDLTNNDSNQDQSEAA